MLWDAFIGLRNNKGLLKEKANLLAQLILNASTDFHSIASLESEYCFSMIEKQYSETEMSALYAARVLSLISRFIDAEEANCLTHECITGVSSFMSIRDPTGELVCYFEGRYMALFEIAPWGRKEAALGWAPDFANSYKEQQKILNLQPNAMIAASVEDMMMRKLVRWELRQLVLGVA